MLLRLFFTSAMLVALSAPAQDPVSFARDIKPILSNNCFMCHGPDEGTRKGGLRLDEEEAAREVLGSGTANSVLWARVTAANPHDLMPPQDTGKILDADQLAKLESWINAGARYERHWAFVKPERPALPEVREAAWAKNEVDRFVLARLEAEGLAPSPEADAVTLLRRVYLDLIGLPPTREQVQAYASDTGADAYKRVVDQLLASPHFGERWGRHWLDAARYADSNGYSIDAPRSIWPWRDWVINALNADMPFDQFVIEQTAGDLLPDATREQRVATGFHRNTMINQEGGVDPEEFRLEAVMDRVNTVGTVFLGLTLGCARCHTHKYDPVEQSEYFKLVAFFNNDEEPELSLPTPEQEAIQTEVAAELSRLEAELKAYLEGAAKGAQEGWEDSRTLKFLHRLEPAERAVLSVPRAERSDEQKTAALEVFKKHDLTARKLQGEIAKTKQRLPEVPTTMVLAARAEPRETKLLVAGDYTRPGEPLQPGGIAALHPMPAGARTRLDFAQWLVSPENPLTARVTVNRFWQKLFGRGLVETEDDFGIQGSVPTHPQLLDWLAVEFREQGWSIKGLLRTLVTSATYRQTSHVRPELEEKDPRNLLLARQNRIRLDAEIIRDSALSVAGVLNPTIGGPSAFPPQPDGVMKLGQSAREWTTSEGADRFRRGMYTYFWRATPHPALVTFDAPDASAACTRRTNSNTPLQALTLLNDPAYFELAQALAGRLKDSGPNSVNAFALCLGREPSPGEADILEDLIAEEQQRSGEEGAVLALARAMLNLDEFMTRE